jgi:hypothetical protein
MRTSGEFDSTRLDVTGFLQYAGHRPVPPNAFLELRICRSSTLSLEYNVLDVEPEDVSVDMYRN